MIINQIFLVTKDFILSIHLFLFYRNGNYIINRLMIHNVNKNKINLTHARKKILS